MADLADDAASAPVTLSEPGPAPETPDTGTASDAPADDDGPASTSTDATELEAPQTTADSDTGTDSFLDDPSEVPEELQARYKEMQSAWTKKTMGLADKRKSLEQLEQYQPLIEAYQRDPAGTLQDLAKQQGFSLTRGQAEQAVQEHTAQPQQQGVDWDNYEPQTWKDVADTIRQDVRQEILGQVEKDMAPVVENFRKMNAQHIETQLAEIDPEWRQHESTMVQVLKQHPTLADDPSMLYRMAVPPEVLEQRANERAQSQYKEKAKAARVSSKSTIRAATASPKQPKSISEAYELAREQLASGG